MVRGAHDTNDSFVFDGITYELYLLEFSSTLDNFYSVTWT